VERGGAAHRLNCNERIGRNVMYIGLGGLLLLILILWLLGVI
jgi:hypothetical protein